MTTHEIPQLQQLLKEAQINEQKLMAMQAIELRLLNAADFYEICGILVCDYRRQFNLLAVNLTFIDRANSWQQLLNQQSEKYPDYPLAEVADNIYFESDYQNIERMRTLCATPIVGALKPEYRGFLGRNFKDTESVAILPLAHRGDLIGIIAFSSVDPARFSADMRTDFLDRLALTVTVCMQNTLHIENLKFMGMVDYATQLFNKKYFDRRLVEEVKRAQRCDEKITLMLISVDGLPQLRERRGHTAAEVALSHSARLLQEVLRETDICARLGEYEFGVILPNTFDVGAVEVAERLVRTFRTSPCELSRSRQLPLRISLGLVSVDVVEIIAEAQVIASNLIKRANKARALVFKKGGDGYEAALD